MIERVADLAPVLPNGFSWDVQNPSRRTQVDHRTNGTPGLAREANSGAEFHHGLVEISWTLATQQILSCLPQLSLRQVGTSYAPENPLHIPVHRRDWHVECDAGNGCSRVAADTGKVRAIRRR